MLLLPLNYLKSRAVKADKIYSEFKSYALEEKEIGPVSEQEIIAFLGSPLVFNAPEEFVYGADISEASASNIELQHNLPSDFNVSEHHLFNRPKFENKITYLIFFFILTLIIIIYFIIKLATPTEEELALKRLKENISGVPRVIVNIPLSGVKDADKSIYQRALEGKIENLTDKLEITEKLSFPKNKGGVIDMPKLRIPLLPTKSIDDDDSGKIEFSGIEDMKAEAEDKTGTLALEPIEPLNDMLERTSTGLLIPKINLKGIKPWIRYAKSFNFNPEIPRIAIIVRGLGFREDFSNAAINGLPANVGLSFSPYSKNCKEWMKKARQKGHEVFLDLPIETDREIFFDPGNLGAMQLISDSDRRQKLELLLSKGGAYLGLIAQHGMKNGQNVGMDIILNEVKKRGLLFVNNRTDNNYKELYPQKTPQITADMDIYDKLFPAAINARLEYLKTLAQYNGYALAIVDSKPVNLRELSNWLKELEGPPADAEEDHETEKDENSSSSEKFILAPVSSIITE